ncbi:EpsI family protein [Singulisphaera rosea]
MSPVRRVAICAAILTFGYGAQAGLESMSHIERPLLEKSLNSLPMELGDWVGYDEPVDEKIIKEAQTTEFLNRVYKRRDDPSHRLTLWINYSREGLNLRHTPEICLPSGGWSKVESQCRVLPVEYRPDKSQEMTRLVYTKGELVEGIGFWYYIFGEGRMERYVRRLPITSRSSHGRTTRGSGMTVEVFCPIDSDPNSEALKDFAKSLLVALEPILPRDRAEYYIP